MNIVGGVGCTTVTVKVPLAALDASSFTVHVTVVVPNGNASPGLLSHPWNVAPGRPGGVAHVPVAVVAPPPAVVTVRLAGTSEVLVTTAFCRLAPAKVAPLSRAEVRSAAVKSACEKSPLVRSAPRSVETTNPAAPAATP